MDIARCRYIVVEGPIGAGKTSLARQLAAVRKDETLPYLRPDGKTQVTVEYEKGQPVAVRTIVLAAQHSRKANNQRRVLLVQPPRSDLRRHQLLELRDRGGGKCAG